MVLGQVLNRQALTHGGSLNFANDGTFMLATGFLLVLARVGAVVMTAPILGSRAVPIRFRVVAALLLSLAAWPLVSSPADVPINSGQIFSAIGREAMLGAALGMGVAIMFAAASMAGTVIGQMAGVRLQDQLDPVTGDGRSPVSQLFNIVSLAAFALMGGPELVISALLNTFVAIPIGSELPLGETTAGLAGLVSEVLRQSFQLMLRGVGPAVAALMISTLTIGMIGRSYPQMNLLGIGLASNVAVMFLAVFLTTGGCVWLFVDDFGGMLDLIQTSLGGAGYRVGQ